MSVQVKAVTGLCQRGSVRKRCRKKGTKERQLELSTKCYRGVNSCPTSETMQDSRRSRRPDSVRRARVPAEYQHVIEIRSCPREDSDWNFPPLDQRQPHHFDVFAHLRTGLGWITGVALPSLLPPDEVRRTGRALLPSQGRRLRARCAKHFAGARRTSPLVDRFWYPSSASFKKDRIYVRFYQRLWNVSRAGSTCV